MSTPAPYTAHRSAWEADMERARVAVAPYVIESDGELFISTECPPPLATHYSALVSVGYASGFFPRSGEETA